ncbi:MAG: alpha/beta hydrolase [Proteobacteria bacterium]|nr:alpha/beta hydrolase [Pseudomonadota bacterium]
MERSKTSLIFHKNLGALFLLLLTSCSSLLYHPDKSLYLPHQKSGQTAHEIEFKTSDNVSLSAWFFPTKSNPPKGTVTLFHGNGQNISSHYLSVLWLVPQGYQIFVFDYRGYGKSQGSPSPKGTYLDGLAALDKAWDLHQTNKALGKPFVVIGQSLGGTIALRSIQDFTNKDEVTHLVLDSTFLSYVEIARDKMLSSFITWPLSIFAGLLFSDEFAATESLKTFKNSVLVIHDKNDDVIPFAFGKEIYEKAKEPKYLWALENVGHIGSFNTETPS